VLLLLPAWLLLKWQVGPLQQAWDYSPLQFFLLLHLLEPTPHLYLYLLILLLLLLLLLPLLLSALLLLLTALHLVVLAHYLLLLRLAAKLHLQDAAAAAARLPVPSPSGHHPQAGLAGPVPRLFDRPALTVCCERPSVQGCVQHHHHQQQQHHHPPHAPSHQGQPRRLLGGVCCLWMQVDAPWLQLLVRCVPVGFLGWSACLLWPGCCA
jgi:hypothetical protein